MLQIFEKQKEKSFKAPLPKRPSFTYFGTPISSSDQLYYAICIELAPFLTDGEKEAKLYPTGIIIPLVESEMELFSKAYRYVDLVNMKNKPSDVKIMDDVPYVVNNSRNQ